LYFILSIRRHTRFSRDWSSDVCSSDLQGYKVYAVARRVGNMKELEALDIKTAFMDITDDDSIDAVVTSILHTEGRLDILINNAGFGLYGAFEEVSIQEARRQLDVNLIEIGRAHV